VILKIETYPKLGKIIHIAMRGLKMKNRRSPDGISEDVNHMPFSEKATEKSGLKLLKEKVDLPDYAEGYRLWREAFDAGQAGIYTNTIAEAVSVMEATLNQ
jgi:cyclopropane fatty-acyl-phospholipid synthase-like methyltransferase